MKKAHGFFTRLVAACCVAMLPVTLAACSGDASPSDAATAAFSTRRPTVTHDSLDKAQVPSVRDDSPHAKAVRAVESMSVEERVGQLVMAPLFAGSDPSSLYDLIANRHVGSVLIIGNWTSGIAGVAAATSTLQSYAPGDNQLLMSTDQEGGLVQHLKGAPVVGTVTVDRSSNAPIGALYRDFGLDPAGNADHAKAFIQGMSDSGVGSAIKHYPGLGSVTGNTDFTANGILDTTTTLDGPEISAFNSTLEASPSMVMMSLATYQAIDPNNPAVFSSTLVTGYLRGKIGFQGVVTSDSLSATALSGVQPSDLGVRRFGMYRRLFLRAAGVGRIERQSGRRCDVRAEGAAIRHSCDDAQIRDGARQVIAMPSTGGSRLKRKPAVPAAYRRRCRRRSTAACSFSICAAGRLR